MGRTETRLLDAAGLDRLIVGLADRVARDRRPDAPLALVGIRTRGVPIAARLAEALRGRLGIDVPVGAVDITLYRDDVGLGRRWPVLKGTDIPFGLDDAEVVLVDDVLFTGRTVRAALNAICDLGRPARVRLAVVVDRGGRELPIRADYAGEVVEAGPGERVEVRVAPIDPAEGVIRVAGDPR